MDSFDGNQQPPTVTLGGGGLCSCDAAHHPIGTGALCHDTISLWLAQQNAVEEICITIARFLHSLLSLVSSKDIGTNYSQAKQKWTNKGTASFSFFFLGLSYMQMFIYLKPIYNFLSIPSSLNWLFFFFFINKCLSNSVISNDGKGNMEYKNWQFNEFLDNTFFKALRHSAFQKKKKGYIWKAQPLKYTQHRTDN